MAKLVPPPSCPQTVIFASNCLTKHAASELCKSFGSSQLLQKLNMRPQTTLKRIHREIADLKKEDLGNITLAPSDDNLFNWKATIPGPEGSVYEGGLFQVDITLAHDYP